jgi:hypothetical protein
MFSWLADAVDANSLAFVILSWMMQPSGPLLLQSNRTLPDSLANLFKLIGSLFWATVLTLVHPSGLMS